MAPIEQLIDSLPVGSITFAEQVASKLWRHPLPTEVRALGIIAEERATIPVPSRRAALKGVAIRQRVGRLLYTAMVEADPDRFIAIANEWVRLANVARDTRRNWPIGSDGTAEVRVLKAAFDLLPDPQELESEAALNAEAARLIEAVKGGTSAGVMMWNAPVAEVEDLTAAIKSGKLGPDQALCLEIFAACVLATRHMQNHERNALERDRRVLQVVHDRLEQRVDHLVAAHVRDPATSRRLAAWRRFLNETRSRVDEAITRPGETSSSDHSTGPVGGPEAAPSSEAPSATTNDGSVVEKLRKIRSGFEPEASISTVVPVWRRFLGAAIGGVVLLVLLLIRASLPAAVPQYAVVDLQRLEPAIALSQGSRAGALLLGAVDPAWEQLPARQQRLETARLLSLAEEQGMTAGVLFNAEGMVLARWSPGRPPEMRGDRPAPSSAARDETSSAGE